MKKNQQKHPTYINCKVCEEWICFENFEKWYNENYYEIKGQKMRIDKDIICKNNKVYCPQYCRIVPNEINCLFTKSNKIRGQYLTYNKKANKFKAQLSITKDGQKTRKSLGTFSDEIEAFNAYKIAKEEYIKSVADKYKECIPTDIYKAMYTYQVEITD